MADANSTTRIEYRKIARFFGYRFGDDGSIWSRRKRIVPGTGGGRGNHWGWSDEWRKMSTPANSRGYAIVILCTEQGQFKNQPVHRLILEAFVGPCPSGMQCRHLNGNSLDNRLENLAWGTAKENSADRIRHGTQSRFQGEKVATAKLTEEQVLAIRWLAKRGTRQREIGEAFNVTQSYVSQIVARKTWSHLTE